MPSFDPQDLAGWTGGSWFNEPKVAIEGLCFDARQIKPGQCFIALKISARDGHEFLEQAARGGAVAAHWPCRKITSPRIGSISRSTARLL